MLNQNKIMGVGEVYFNKSDGKKLEIMNERSNRKKLCLLETTDLQEGAFLEENQR